MNEQDENKFRYYAGVRVFFNPHLFGGMKEITENAARILIIHTALETYGIDKQYVAAYESFSPPSITLQETISWRLNAVEFGLPSSGRAFHNFYATPRNKRECIMPYPIFQLPYFDTERIEHSDGLVLWRKNRGKIIQPKHAKGTV